MKSLNTLFNTSSRFIFFAGVFLFGMMPFISSCGGGGGSSDDPIGSSTNEFVEVNIGPDGGDFDLSNGLILSIPPNAVTEKTTFQFRVIDEAEVEFPSTIFRQFDKSFIAGFEAKPYGYIFAAPISITFTSPLLIEPNSLIYPLAVKTDVGRKLSIFPTSTDTSITEASSPAAIEDYLVDLGTITLNEDGSISVPDLSSLPEDQRKIILAEIKKLRESDCTVQPCRCERIKIESSDFDSSSEGNDGCYSVYSDGFVQYLDCPYQPIEPWSLHEANLDLTVIPTNATIKVGEIFYFSLKLTDENGLLVTNYSIDSLNIEDTSVIATVNIGPDSIGIKGVSPGISSLETIITSAGCQYNVWFSVEVEPSKIIAIDKVSIPEGDHTGISVKLSDPPPVAQTVLVTAFVDGDDDISIVSGEMMTFNASNWNSDQYMIVASAEDDQDAVNGDAFISLLSSLDYYEAANISVSEIDNDTVNFIVNKNLVGVPEGGSAILFLRLNIEPENMVTAATFVGGGSSISVSSGASLSFDSSNWDTYQPITFSAIKDSDCDDELATITITDVATAVSSLGINAIEIDFNEDCGGGDGGGDDPTQDPDVFTNHIYMEGSETNWNGTRANWHGVVPITVEHFNNGEQGTVQGTGIIFFNNSYSWLSYHSDGSGNLMECFFKESGVLNVEITGSRVKYPDVMPRYYLTAHQMKNTISQQACSDSSYWRETHEGLFKDRGIYLDDQNGYVDAYFDPQIHYWGELLDKTIP